jgi:hypothetical protein
MLLILTVSFYTLSSNLLILLYTGGLYLLLVGGLAFLNDSDVFIGFLWVIDLGVGLVFFIFILHFTFFLFQKSQFNVTARHFIFTLSLLTSLLILFYFSAFSADTSFYGDLSKTWFFKINYVDYYLTLVVSEVTELNTLKDSYFLVNSFEFFLINFSLFFGLIASILLCFMLQRVFVFLNYSQIINMELVKYTDTNLFIRNQNFIQQQLTPGLVKA